PKPRRSPPRRLGGNIIYDANLKTHARFFDTTHSSLGMTRCFCCAEPRKIISIDFKGLTRHVIGSRADGEGPLYCNREYASAKYPITCFFGVAESQGSQYCSCEVSAPPLVAVPSMRFGMTALVKRPVRRGSPLQFSCSTLPAFDE